MVFYLCQGFLANVVVEGPFIGTEVNLHRNLSLFGQFVEHFALCASEDERCDDAFQLALAFLVVVAFYGQEETVGEVCERTEEIGIGKLHEVPHLADVILQRCTGEHESEVCL